MLTSMQLKVASVCKWETHQRAICTLSSRSLHSNELDMKNLKGQPPLPQQIDGIWHILLGYFLLNLIAKGATDHIVHTLYIAIRSCTSLGSFSWTWRIAMIRSPHADIAIKTLKKDQHKEQVPSCKRGAHLSFSIHSFIGSMNTRYMQSFSFLSMTHAWIFGMRNDQSSRDHKIKTAQQHQALQHHCHKTTNNHHGWRLQLTRAWLKGSLTLTFRDL
jgi:hypothetical protein